MKSYLRCVYQFNKKNYPRFCAWRKRLLSSGTVSTMDENIKCRKNPIVMKLDTPAFKSIFTDELDDIRALFAKYGYEMRIAGGAVRDILMGMTPKDLDFATTATPIEMKDMFTKENIRMINMNGEKHGTITARINDKENFEITTLRIDLITDGRHAEVKFTTNWKLDANRRDLTVNSMFLGFDGSVFDYFYGYEDILARRVAFVGNADTRIKEDYLRILRYFRFYGRIAEKPNNHDDIILKIITENAMGLKQISGERIWTELKKILAGNFAGDILKTMIHVGIGEYTGLPEAPNIAELDKIWEQSQHLNMHPMTLLASLLDSVDDVIVLNNRLKVSAYDRDLAFFIVNHREDKPSPKPLLPYQKLLLNTTLKHKDVREYIIEVLKYRNDEELIEMFNDWTLPRFPVTGATLAECCVQNKKIYGIIIKHLKNYWADCDFDVSVEELVKKIPEIENEINEKSAKGDELISLKGKLK